jgi:hypothetical protein
MLLVALSSCKQFSRKHTMNSTFANLFAQAPGLASSFDDIFKKPIAVPLAPPTPAALPTLRPIPTNRAGE